MIRCERCGHEMPDSVTICPSCGTLTGATNQPPVTGYGQPQMGAYGQGYGPQVYSSSPQQGYPPANQQAGYMPPQPGYGTPYPPASVNVTLVNNVPSSSKKTGALVAEILLTLFLSVYGVGWLMAGETTIGLVLLLGSIFLLWPFVVVFSLFTFFIADCFIVPLLITAVIVNAILLNKTLERKALTQQVVVQTHFR